MILDSLMEIQVCEKDFLAYIHIVKVKEFFLPTWDYLVITPI